MDKRELIGSKVDVGSHGFVQLVDVMGDDRRIVNAARISYGGEARGDGRDRSLLRYLMRHRHTSPFEQCELVFIIKAPMDVWRQWIRHRTASVNEYSTRYTEAISECTETPPVNWRFQSGQNKQGSTDGRLPADVGQDLTDGERRVQTLAREEYERRLTAGVAREQARKDLPLSTYTIAYWKIDLHNLLHFLGLRMDLHAQLEIREYATAMYEEFVKPLFPWVAEAFEDYRLNAVAFTGPEIVALREMLVDAMMKQSLPRDQYFDQVLVLGHKLSKRESEELKSKLEDIYDRVDA